MGILHAAYGELQSFKFLLFVLLLIKWFIMAVHYILRCRSIHISIHRNTICSTTPLVFQFSHFFRNRYDQRHLPRFCLQTQTPRWYVVHLISPDTLHNLHIFTFQNIFFKRFFPECLLEAGGRKTQPAAMKNGHLQRSFDFSSCTFVGFLHIFLFWSGSDHERYELLVVN